MKNSIQPKLYISTKTRSIGLQLLNKLEISITAPLAFYLGVNPSYDGHQATFIWAEYFLEKNPNAEFSEILEAFLALVPKY